MKAQRYLYQGKEMMDDLNLGIYDFHARAYDPVIGRTLTQDPHGDKYHSMRLVKLLLGMERLILQVLKQIPTVLILQRELILRYLKVRLKQ